MNDDRRDEAVEAMMAGFAEALNLDLGPGTLTAEEQAWAEEFRAGKYATADWSHRV